MEQLSREEINIDIKYIIKTVVYKQKIINKI